MVVKHRWKHLVNLLAGGHLKIIQNLTSQATDDDNNQTKHERLSLTLLVHENMTPRTS